MPQKSQSTGRSAFTTGIMTSAKSGGTEHQAKKKDWRSRRAIPVLHEVLHDLGETFGSSFLLLVVTPFQSDVRFFERKRR